MNLKSQILETYPDIEKVEVGKDANYKGHDTLKIVAYTTHSITGKRYKHELQFARKNSMSQEEMVKVVGSYLNGWENGIN